MNKLYPLKFRPVLKKKVWGGNTLHALTGSEETQTAGIGEAWVLSGLQDGMSLVSNGFLKENNLKELIEVYMGDLVGEKVFGRFGLEFPLLIKFINTTEIA